MTNGERFKVIMNILEKGNFRSHTLYYDMFDKLSDDELSDEEKVLDIIKKISKYESYQKNNTNKYSEDIMFKLRQRRGLDKMDVSEDDNINKMSSKKVFSEVCAWEGLLGGWDYTIRCWIEDIK